jgi:sugar lactone lactonase YvrE
MVVTATYSDNSTAAVANGTLTFSPSTFGTAGANQTVTITYQGKTATVTGITVNAAAAALAITSFSPASAQHDAVVTITGTAFSTTATDNKVSFNGVEATVTSAAATELKVTVPKDKTATGKISVTVNGKTVSSATDFTYLLTAVVSTIAGSNTPGFAGDGASGASAFNGVQFNNPAGVAVFSGVSGTSVYVSDSYNFRIRKLFYGISPLQNSVSTLAGGQQTQFNLPAGIAVDASGNVYVADQFNFRIQKITSGGTVSTLTANGFKPADVAVDVSGNVYVADIANHRILKVSPDGSSVTTLAGSGTAGFTEGNGTAAQFSSPSGVAVDKDGNVYVADAGNFRIRKITPAGAVSTLAGSTKGFVNGTGSAAQFSEPLDVTVDASGNVYVADAGSISCIRKITSAGVVTTVAGNGAPGYADGTTGTKFDKPVAVAVNAFGNVYVADLNNQRIRLVAFE